MKKTLLLIMLACFVVFGIAQNKNSALKKPVYLKARIDVAKQFDFGETYRTFNISNTNIENTKSKFIKRFGKPIVNNVGTLKWEKVNIENIGENLTLILRDGVFTKSNAEVSYMIFTSTKMKVKELQNLSATKIRMLDFKITNNENHNIIKNNNMEKMVMTLLVEELKL